MLFFGYFLQLDGSIWSATVIFEQGIQLRRSGHPTCLYSDNFFGPKIWVIKSEGLGQIGASGASESIWKASGWASMTYNYVFYMWEVFQGHLDPSRASWGPHVCFGHIWSKITKSAVVKNFRSRSRKNQFFILKYGPKPTFCCNMRKIWGDSFWEIALFWIPYFGHKRVFFGPETEILAQNFKNIVL